MATITGAPDGTPSLEERIVDRLARAGIAGLDAGPLWNDVAPYTGGSTDRALMLLSDRTMSSLIERGVVECLGYSWYRLSPAEWARRVVAEARLAAAAFGLNTPIVEHAVKALLSGEREPAPPQEHADSRPQCPGCNTPVEWSLWPVRSWWCGTCLCPVDGPEPATAKPVSPAVPTIRNDGEG